MRASVRDLVVLDDDESSDEEIEREIQAREVRERASAFLYRGVGGL